MCELCGCAWRRTLRQVRPEGAKTGIPIRDRVIAVALGREAAGADAAGGKPADGDGRPGKGDKRALESGAPVPA